MTAFLREARRRKLHTTAVAYLALAAGGIQLSSSVAPALGLPEWTTSFVIVLFAVGLPVVLVLGWIYDINFGGISRTHSLLESQTKPAPVVWGGSFATTPEAPVSQIELVEEAPDPGRVRRASIGFVRHELRTPINAIIGYSEMLLDDAHEEGDAVAAADLERIVRCGRDILAQVERILDAERVSDEQHRDLESYAEQIRIDLREPLNAIIGYTDLLIDVSEEAGKTARVADLRRILDAAEKLLALSNDIVAIAMHAPNESHLSRGATLAEGVLSKIRSVADQQGQPERTGSLLVVDDSATTRDLLAKQLARKGYLVMTASSGIEALEKMAEQHFDLVLLDLIMPELDGIGTLVRMKNDVRLRGVPVIMISALDEVDSVVRCLELGAADFVTKPFHPTLLDARINATLGAHVARRRSSQTGESPAISRIVSGTFPSYIVERLRRGETRLLDGSQNAAVWFVDIDQALAASDPPQRAALTESLIELADDVAARDGTTVILRGLGLSICAGFPDVDADATDRIARTALAFSREAEAMGLKLRSGMHVGTLFSAVVGKDNLSYFLWGEAIDLARRLAIGADRGQIQMSAACYNVLKDRFAIASRGVIDVAGRGQMRAYLLEGSALVKA